MKNILILITLLCPFYCGAQTFAYKDISDIPDFVQPINEAKERRKIIDKTFVDATTYLPRNFSRLGNIDYTSYLQKALNENKKVILPDFPVLINDNGLTLQSNQELVFQKNSKLALKPSDKTNYAVLNILNVTNVLVFSPKIEGDKYTHTGKKKGEWGMGINISSSSNITIINPQISKCWGDGIYIGETGTKQPCRQITIKNGCINDSRRNGISVITVDGLTISDLVVANTSGTNPQVAIDFEPNYKDNTIKNVSLNRVYTYNNKNQGLFFQLSALNGKMNEVSISVNDYLNNGSPTGIGFQNVLASGATGKVSGNIILNNIEYKNTKDPLRVINAKTVKGDINIKVTPRNRGSLLKADQNIFTIQ